MFISVYIAVPLILPVRFHVGRYPDAAGTVFIVPKDGLLNPIGRVCNTIEIIFLPIAGFAHKGYGFLYRALSADARPFIAFPGCCSLVYVYSINCLNELVNHFDELFYLFLN